MKLKKLLILPLAAMILTACGGKSDPSASNQGGGGKKSSSNCDSCQTREGDQKDELLPTPITDSFKFAQANELEGKTFAGPNENAVDHLGYVSLRSCTDGDTANFNQDGYLDEFGAPATIKTRFLGVNTPESTAKVEPWGKKASLFTKHALEEAQADAEKKSTATKKVYNIALINHPSPSSFEIKDSSGGRWLAFVWYRPTSESDWRLLNLELVEQGFSRNQLFVDDPVCNYRQYFEAADTKNTECKYRVFGEVDEGYDYEEKTYEYSLWKIINDFENIGISDTGSSGVVLCVSALVVGIQGDNMFLRDLLLDNEQVEKGDNRLAGLYCYAGYNSSVCSILQKASERNGMDGTGVGVIVRFFCRATTYNGNVQLSDLKYSTTGKKGFKVLTTSNFATYAEELKWSNVYEQNGAVTFDDLTKDPTTIRLEPSTLTTYDDPLTTDIMYDDLAPYQYQFIDTEVTIRSVGSGDKDEEGASVSGSYWYKGNANDNSYTVYATINGKDDAKILTNLRIDNSLNPFIEAATFGTSNASDLTSENSPVGKTWHVTGYLALYFGKFQILLPNNYAKLHYLYEVKQKGNINMKRLFRALILPAMMMATLSACGSGSKKFNELCAKAADTAPLLLNSATGKEIFASSHKRELADYNSVLGLKTFTYSQKEFDVEWEATPADKWVSSTYLLDETRIKMAPIYGPEGFEASLKCTVSYSEKGKVKGKTSLEWFFDVAKTEVVEKTLRQINEEFVANGKKLGSLATDEEGKAVQIGTRGYITATYEESEHVYAGVFIQDGEYSLQLYAGQISSLWKENGLKVGDCIFVVGPLSMYGIIEMKPTLMEPIDGAAYNIASPVTVSLEGKQMQAEENWLNQSSLVELPGCKYKSGLDKFDPKNHSTLVYECGTMTVKLYCSYHLGETMMDEIKTLVDATKGNPPTVTIKGILTYSSTDSDFEIIPVFGTGSIVTPATAA